MSTIVDNFNNINSNIVKIKPNKEVKVIAVSKTFSLNHVKPLVNYGHIHFGENKVQEATVKWQEEKKENHNIKLHMLGKLQSNKAKDAVKTF